MSAAEGVLRRSGRGSMGTLADLLVGEVEDLVEHLLLGLLDLADVLGRPDAVDDVLARVGDDPGRGRREANGFVTTRAETSIQQMTGPNTTLNQESGGASKRAICSAICSVTVFGMSSPKTTVR